MTTSLPRVSVAFLSWNRLHYLRATVESARVCIDYPNLEWLLSDNDSMEPGLADYLDGLSWFDQILLRKQDHAAAMNELLAAATGKYIFI
ncbi:MAG: glycosyltransferase family A protein, partial [Arenicellales bacterium]